MNKKFSLEECIQVYEKLINNTNKLIRHHKFEKALAFITAAARWAYHFNFIYADKRLDDFSISIGHQWIQPFTIKKDGKTRYLLLDTHGTDNRGLTQQYLRALISMNVEFLFVSLFPTISKQQDIRTELASYPKAKTLYLDGEMTPQERVKTVAETIKNYQPQIALAHIMPWDAMALMILNAAKGLTIYNINFTDHAFWIGSSIFNYNIEFRAYGMSVSLDKRGLKKEQLISLPFYPIKPLNEPFKGFPSFPKDSIIIFSGGSFYKMMGENDQYFKICDRLLDISPKVVIIIAGSGDNSLIEKKIFMMRNASRVYLIGNRRDINEVFKHCDIYLNTYPLLGGLMSQYAVANGKPLLTLGKANEQFSQIEGIVNHFNNNVRTFYNLDEMINYATQCIEDKEYRLQEGLKNQLGLMTEEKFNSILSKVLSGKHIDCFHWEKTAIDYNSITKLYLDVENNYSKQALKVLSGQLHSDLFILFPQYIVYTLPIVYNYILKTLK